MKKIGVGDFVKRQTPESQFSHFTGGTWEDLERIVERDFVHARPGYREGVRIVDIFSADGDLKLFSGVVKVLPETPLTVKFEASVPGEDPAIFITAVGKKMPAPVADVVIYRRDVLEETHEVTVEAEWEIISINARMGIIQLMSPMAMARNMLELPGGTKAEYTAQQFAESIEFWSRHAMCAEVDPKQRGIFRLRAGSLDHAINCMETHANMRIVAVAEQVAELRSMRDDYQERDRRGW